MKKIFSLSKLGLFVAFFVVMMTTSASAVSMLNQEVPDYIVIEQNGYEWVWGGPCAPEEPSCGVIDLTFQSQFGWRLPTLEELVLHPDAVDFLTPDGNATGAMGTYACGSPWFNSVYDHCDWGDGARGSWWGVDGNFNSWAEALVIRDIVASVPEPATILLLASGLIGLGFFRRKTRIE